MKLNEVAPPTAGLSFKTLSTPIEREKRDMRVFDDVFAAALSLFNDTNATQLGADRAQLDFASGKNDDVLSVIMAEQKAYTALDFTVQVTSRAIEAYREIMRIQL